MSIKPDTMSDEVRGELRRRLGRFGLEAWFSDEDEKWIVYRPEKDDPCSLGEPLCWCATAADIFDFVDLFGDIAKTFAGREAERKAKHRGRP
jgi:hypothetical protein